MSITRVLVCALLLELALFGVSFSQECQAEAKVVVSSQQDLRGLIDNAFDSFSCISDASTSSPMTAASEELSTMLRNEFDTINRKLDSLEAKLKALHKLGDTPCHAASSCAEVLENGPDSPSGYYWVTNATGHPHSVYCDMTRSCGGVAGGWMRVAHLNMTNTSHQCPSGLRQRTDSGVRTCAPYSDSATCSSVLLEPNGLHYSSVCGRIKAYQVSTLDGFYQTRSGGIDSYYVDGVSLTHGRSTRHHIWTFSCRNRSGRNGCSCGSVPAFVGNDYFCDGVDTSTINLNNPLWDGEDCGSNTCCSFNTPPWFYKQLSQPTTDNVEMRVCRNQERSNEDVAIEVVEIYIK